LGWKTDMNNLEKINIYVPDDVYYVLHHDAVEFEILKSNGKGNLNRFLSLLIIGYQAQYTTEYTDNRDRIIEILNGIDGFSTTKIDELANRVMQNVLYPSITRRKGKKSKSVSLKPTTSTEGYILSAEQNTDNGTLSQYFCRMFMAYAKKNQAERERIVFKEKLDYLNTSCRKGLSVRFALKNNPSYLHTVIPFRVSSGHEELHNYLLCQELDQGRLCAASYRLDRIVNYTSCAIEDSSINPVIKERLDRMVRYGPQYRINSDDITKVLLTTQGIRDFGRVYYGRPEPIDIVKNADGSAVYCFQCSDDQLYLYFRRFDNVAILEPERLKNRIRDFHQRALECVEREI